MSQYVRILHKKLLEETTVSYILLSCVLTLSKMFSATFKPEKSTGLLKLTVSFNWPVYVI